MRKPGLCTQNTPIHIIVCIFITVQDLQKSVNCTRLSMNSCINGENCAGIACVFVKLFNFEIQKCCQILCAHKPYFLMPGHNC